jgi:hypothetical protein
VYDIKASIAERVIRTIKTKLFRYFTHARTWKYTDVLGDLVTAYNSSKHRSIGMSPAKVTAATEEEVRQKLYPPKVLSQVKFKFNINETVRLAKGKAKFGKGYNQHWTEEIFRIHERRDTIPPTYLVKDSNDEVVSGGFYEPELQSVVDTGAYDIEQVLKTRRRNGKTEYFVTWRGYPLSTASWVSEIISL